MGIETTDNDRVLSNWMVWAISSALRPPPEELSIMMTTLETGNGIDVLMVIKTNDNGN
jgi:hypothetical protein